ncbi:SMP-30/gluconolactonase/LRE family protein [Shewanella maritima]|uniref:SMP-30/gluconolactonase/LRE family protein n=1 Tax=Shewanella maritima TaxID=2520507 RepID=A0A411PDM8_9GAMM|nr:SMP-30/gluconolactonase/LRE family protein [Shewanella maritima]QBF81562.1 SMP-30/gluconolactonase/LRE family protein [Shewanella maritima]
MIKKLLTLASVSLMMFGQANAQKISEPNLFSQCDSTQLPLAESSKPKVIATGMRFLEGPTWSVNTQRFYFSEMNFDSDQSNGPKSNIYQWHQDSGVKLVAQELGTNGLLADNDKLYVMDHGQRALSTVNLTELNNPSISNLQLTPLVTNYNNKAFNSPNDLVRHSKGHIYFTDPDWQLGPRQQHTPFTGVYWRAPNGELTLVSNLHNKPNGIALSPDESTLYVGDYSNKVTLYELNADGSIGNIKTRLDVASPDGMAVDCAGNLYVTSHGPGEVQIFNAAHQHLRTIHFGESVTNLAFGGKDGKTLLVTSAKGTLFTLRTELAGLGQFM